MERTPEHSKGATRGSAAWKLLLDLGLIAAALSLAILLDGPTHPFQKLFAQNVLLLPLGGLLLTLRGVYRAHSRYTSVLDVLHLLQVCLGMGLALFALQAVFPAELRLRPIVPVLFTLLSLTLLTSTRMVHRIRTWMRRNHGLEPERALIVGAGDAGELMLRDLTRSAQKNLVVIGLVDDDPGKQGMRIHGVPVIGTLSAIPRLTRELSVQEIFIALPSAGGETMRRVVDLCKQTQARVRTLPATTSVVLGKARFANQLREVEISDLLRRDAVKTDLKAVAEYIQGSRVMITGAGGSIGSELARQVSALPPAHLLLLGRGENSIYEIQQELIYRNNFHPDAFIADVRDRQNMRLAFETHQPEVVFHAAAHKHVPLMETNPLEAIRNNVYGTYLAADLAIRNGVRKFIYVSTDKAVKPSSIMGATKRVGEIIVAAMAKRSETEFASVRFGNVLGSRGSLIPLLEKQIRHGGPLRITHPEMTRFFMTIPEAVQLIVQAGALGTRGELFLLDMGEPIKIVDLARDLIRLHGLEPDKDVSIEFVGTRPGEKLHEELRYERESLIPTPHPKINMVTEPSALNETALFEAIAQLVELCDRGDTTAARALLMDLAWSKGEIPFPKSESPIERS